MNNHDNNFKAFMIRRMKSNKWRPDLSISMQQWSFLARNPNDPSVKWSSYILLLDLLIYWFRCIFQIMKCYLRPILGCRKIEIYLKNQSMLLDFTNTSELWQKPRKRILRACLVFWQSLNINPCFPPTQTHNTVSSTATASGCHWDFLRRK